MTVEQQYWIEANLKNLREVMAVLFDYHNAGKTLPFDFVFMVEQLDRDLRKIVRLLADGMELPRQTQSFTGPVWEKTDQYEDTPQ